MKRRIVVTGIGAITPLGITVNKSWDSLMKGRSGIRVIPESLFDTSDLMSKVAGYISDTKTNDCSDEEMCFVPEKYIEARKISSMDRFIQFAIHAAEEAIKDSGYLCDSEEKAMRAGVIVGSGIGGLLAIEKNMKILESAGPRRISPFFIPSTLINLANGHLSIKYGFKGMSHAIVSACASGAHAIGEAARIISTGELDVALCGGSEAAICRFGLAGFQAARALSKNPSPQNASRPFDVERDGFVMGEGAGIFVLEEYESAKKRNAKIYCEIVGYGSTSDAYHITMPETEGIGIMSAMEKALKDAEINHSDIGYINAHATSTPAGDLIEITTIKKFLGKNYRDIPISATKSYTGHLLGAAGAIEAAFCMMALKHKILPPTIGVSELIEEAKDMNIILNEPLEADISYAMSNSFGFGGTNCVLIFKKI
ncbi:beta-ketoacyl-ACP synthase II [Candidatus Fokinia crypta]|uniref:3-oxoacyl-[acyl-carrier-protein] synthase 2 n=1 Tax=Candidatus Fokinia crypta TaxID=1920990 RepID=A0ABZ0UNW9_9RICK|nr:beta-ketoacyl-ACP synthase II [Candidatus Fokinia cryptica]WPX97826.1 3-oxoacyl-[acyl-carrier-protein] synthase 2 [Candidatus Fokinia cryptica]